MSNDNGQVIPFRLKNEDQPYLSGPARCFDCEYEWEAVAPVGTRQLECSNCEGMAGRFQHKIIRGSKIYRCNCGSVDMRHNGEFLYCSACGIACNL